MGALDAAALYLPLHPFPAVHTLLPERQRRTAEGVEGSYKRQGGGKEVQGKERRRKDEREDDKKLSKGIKDRLEHSTVRREIVQLPWDNLMKVPRSCALI